MGILLPAALALLALAIPIIVLYLLKVKREDLTVSSSFLWQRVLEDRQANAPWQKLQKNWLLLLQLLLLLLMVFVLSRPFFQSEAQASGNIIVLLDASAGMQATDVAPSRFAKAKSEINTIIDQMGGGDQMTLVLMRAFPEVLATSSTSKTELKGALDRARVTNEPAQPKSSIVLAAAAADRNPGTTVVVVSSGTFAREEGLPALKAKIKYIKIGQSDANQAISAVNLRETGGGPQLFVGLNNYSTQPTKVTLSVTIDNKPFDTREVSIGPEDKASVTLSDLPVTTRVVDAKIRPAAQGSLPDYLSVDNEAWTLRNAGSPQKLLLVSSGNTFLELFLGRLPNYKVGKTTPDNYETLANKDTYDLYIFDGYAPEHLPPGGVFLINPPTSPYLPTSSSVNTPTFARLEQSDPLLRYTDLSSVFVKQAQQYQLPGWMKGVAFSSEGTALLASGDNQGQHVVLLGFDTHDSDIGLSTAWPILMINTLSWLQPAGALDQVTEINPGEPISFQMNLTDEISVQPPGQNVQVLKPTSGLASFTDTDRTGIYTVNRKQSVNPNTKTGPAQDNFVVNLYSSLSSNIKPLDDLGLQGAITSPNGSSSKSDRELWQPIALLAIIILMLEWWVFYRWGKRRRLKPAKPLKITKN